ncbi:MAG TPA: restriction endonuclease [Dyella sp.]|uniref:restriction endonuclease n=1 Tax=Dyella sp. TaxID=1869338 RepID=UPI002F95060F
MRRWGPKPVSKRYDDALSRVDPNAFEQLVAGYYRQQGYDVTIVAQPGSFDGGIDLKMRRDGEVTIVQCKRWNAFQVSTREVQQLLGAMMTERATRAILVTSGEFTRAALRSGDEVAQLQLIDGATIRAMLGPVAEPAPKAANDAAPMAVPAPPFPARAASTVSRRPVKPRPVPIWSLALLPGALAILLFALWPRHPAPTVSSPTATSAPLPAKAISDASHARPAHAARTTVPPMHPRPKPVPPSEPATIYRSGDMTPEQYSQWQRRRSGNPSTPVLYTDDNVVYRAGTMSQRDYENWKQRRNAAGLPASTVPVTEAELQSWKRKNEESMRILQQTTPEAPSY